MMPFILTKNNIKIGSGLQWGTAYTDFQKYRLHTVIVRNQGAEGPFCNRDWKSEN